MVITEHMVESAGILTLTWHMTVPFLTSTTCPCNWFRAPYFIMDLLTDDRFASRKSVVFDTGAQ